PKGLKLQDWSKHDERLLQAVENNDSEKVGSLLTKRSLFAAKQDSDGRSAYHLAAMKGYVDCLEVILSHGVDVSAMDSSGKAFSANKPKQMHHFSHVLIPQERCPVNTMDSYGRTALHYAGQCLMTMQTLQTPCFELSPHLASQDGCSPLILAAQMSNHEICRWLIVRGADVNTRDKQGRTALMLACENDSVETVEVLVRSRANVGLVDALGHDAVHYSMVTGNTEILHLLHMESPCPSILQMMAKEKSLTPRKRRAPPPPSSLSTQVTDPFTDTSQSFHALNELKAKMDLEVEGCIQPHLESELASVEKNTEQDIQDMTEKLNEVQERYETAMKEVERLKEQIHLGILSMEDREISPGLDGSKATYEHETESVEMKLLETREAEELKENWLKELEEQVKEMEEKLTHSISLETFEELRTSLNISLEEISKENALLMEKYTEAQDELKQLRGTKVSPEFTATADELKEKLEKLTKSYSELEERFRVLQEEHETKEKELGSLQEELTAMHVPKHKHEEVKQKLSKSLSDANEQLLEIKGKHNTIRQEVTRLQSEVEEQRVHFMPRDEHLKMKEAFEAMKGTVSHLENQLASKQKEYSQLQRQVETTREQTTLKDEQESTVTSLKAEVNSLTIKLNDLTKKHERTCTEVFQVQREALFMKSQKHSAEDELAATQKQLQDLKADSKKITELHKQIEDSAELVKEKDKKITELSKEVFRLKEALNSLSERSNAAAQRVQPAPYKTQPNLEYLESQIKALQHQLKVSAGPFCYNTLCYITIMLIIVAFDIAPYHVVEMSQNASQNVLQSRLWQGQKVLS
uniref:Uncharacterized protein n=1 Tax=Callorhinchus milii TaxID=7868 RepID=A0A4W3JRJ0_CALMI